MKDKRYLKIGVASLILILALSILAVGGAFSDDNNKSQKMFYKHHKSDFSGEHNKSHSKDCSQFKGKYDHTAKWTDDEYRTKMIEKLGLPDDATDEEIKEAIIEWKKNKFSGHKPSQEI
jgi:hypothetical protein